MRVLLAIALILVLGGPAIAGDAPPAATATAACACGGSGEVACPACGGKGISDVCARCEGKRQHACERCAKEPKRGKLTCAACAGAKTITSPCPTCSGGGERTCAGCGGAKSLGCTRCGGRGTVVRLRGGTVVCPNCAGEGRTACATCRKKGTVPCQKTVTEPCRTCGQRGATSCPDCGGDGKTKCAACADGKPLGCDRCKGARKVGCPGCRLEPGARRLEALFAEIDDPEMTTLRRGEAVKAALGGRFEAAIAVDDVATAAGGGYSVRGRTPAGISVTCLFPAGAAGLAELKRGDPLTVAGRLERVEGRAVTLAEGAMKRRPAPG